MSRTPHEHCLGHAVPDQEPHGYRSDKTGATTPDKSIVPDSSGARHQSSLKHNTRRSRFNPHLRPPTSDLPFPSPPCRPSPPLPPSTMQCFSLAATIPDWVMLPFRNPAVVTAAFPWPIRAETANPGSRRGPILLPSSSLNLLPLSPTSKSHEAGTTDEPGQVTP